MTTLYCGTQARLAELQKITYLEVEVFTRLDPGYRCVKTGYVMVEIEQRVLWVNAGKASLDGSRDIG